MAKNLISCDITADKIYKHSGISSTILDSFASPSGNPSGLTYDGTNLISCDYIIVEIYKHSGISSTILDSFASPSGLPFGLTYDGINLISCDYNTDEIYKHSGISSTILDSFASPSGLPFGLAYDGTNLISCDYNTDRIYKHSGISSTILDSFASPSGNPGGLTYDGTNLISCDSSTDKIYKHSGISSTILDSFASPSGLPRGLAYERLFNNDPTAPTSLEVNEKANPTGINCISDLTPSLSAIFNDPDAGDQSNAIQIQVGTISGLSDKWDSGWLADSTIEGNRCTAKTYAGAALSTGTSYYWRCRFRDDDSAEGAWSAWQQFDICAEEEEEEVPGGPVPYHQPYVLPIRKPIRKS